MSTLWVDTDFGFDDLWALLLLRQLGVRIAGVSLVAGNAPLPRVISNALGAARAYRIDAPVWSGAARPLRREPETAERILGPRGMRSRGRHLPDVTGKTISRDAVGALSDWLLASPRGDPRDVLALGPLTNIAHLVQQAPHAADRISRLIWMGGSDGPGNHSPVAEFNALADPDAVRVVVEADVPLDVVDLMVCRQVTFEPGDTPVTDTLTADLLGGYLDIGLERGRAGMAIYDPTAALAAVDAGHFVFEPRTLEVTTSPGEGCGATRFIRTADSQTRLAVRPVSDVSRICLGGLSKDHVHGT